MWEMGFVSAGATLAARVHGTLFVWITNALDTGVPDTCRYFEVPAIPDFAYLEGAYPMLDPTRNFPYGIVVD